MPRTPANVTQADIARILRAAKQAGAAGVEIRCGGAVIWVPLDGRTGPVPVPPEVDDDFVL